MIDTTSSPRRSNKPRTLRSSFCGTGANANDLLAARLLYHSAALRVCCFRLRARIRCQVWRLCSRTASCPFFGGSFLNSSESPRTRFICLSKAMNLQDQKWAHARSAISSGTGLRADPSSCQDVPHLPTICLLSVNVTLMPAGKGKQRARQSGHGPPRQSSDQCHQQCQDSDGTPTHDS